MSPLHALLFSTFSVLALWVVYAWAIAAGKQAWHDRLHRLRPGPHQLRPLDDTHVLRRALFPTEETGGI